ncbi:hypothetical protein KVV02_004258 [Mortierella alpina]|uniref:Transcription initiation factor TFIID subunit 11 n=1 Tax=Mortierella alpina TaxID=64518 RepID=A0A9P7ZX35_MORAP|nr:hypothetical protein KVV02_004258 [Mortierella alpina]
MDDSYPSSPLRPVQADTAATPPAPKKRKNAAATPSLPKPKKQKLPRNLDSITARNQLPNVPSTGGVSKTDTTGSPAMSISGARDDADDHHEGSSGRRVHTAGGSGALSTAEGGEGNNPEGGEAGAEGKDDDEDDHDEEPEYSEFEWTQEANSRDRSKDELKALLDSFSQEQLRRYEVYRRAVLSRPTVKKLVGTILNQQVTQTMAFVVAGFSKVFVGEMVERAREVMEEWGDTGAIRPDHLREAQRRYKKEEQQRGHGAQPPYGYKRRLFCR